MTNQAASARARLLNISKAQGQVYNVLLVRYALEGLLARISTSEFNHQFVLKGAMLFPIWSQTDNPHRETQDLDLLAFGTPEIARLIAVFKVLCQSTEPDGLTFCEETVRAQTIREADIYGGVRVNLQARLDTARIPLQIDVGFGDSIVPAAKLTEYPAILRPNRPSVWAYEKETVIAEKFHAMVERDRNNSRMKDFFDIDYLSQNFEFQATTIIQAIQATFQRRGRQLPTGPVLALTSEFSEDPGKIMQWKAFLKKSPRLPEQALTDVVKRIDLFLSPLISQFSNVPSSWQANWNPKGPWKNE